MHMSFDLEKLLTFCLNEIQVFSEKHKNETFYGFAIDASLLCLNSIEEFDKTLQKYQTNWEKKARNIVTWEELTEKDLADAEYLLGLEERYNNLNRDDKNACLAVINEERRSYREKGNPYKKKEEIMELKENTGDWCYQGFADMSSEVGFDETAYSAHYDMSDEEQLNSEYCLAMDELIEKLNASNIFDCLKQTDDFYVIRVEHNY